MWPAPSPEADVLTQVRRRARRITLRRRIVKTTPAAAIAVAVAVAVSSAGGTASVSITDKLRPADEGADIAVEHAAADEPTTTTTSSTTTTAPVAVHQPRPPERVFAPVVGNVPVEPVPASYATSHPVLTDPQGDAYGMSESAGSDRSLDIVEMDVTADATSVTTTLRILDITAEPRGNADGKPTDVRYKTVLRRDDGALEFRVHRNLPTGTVTADGGFWYPVADAGASGSWRAATIPVRASIDMATGVVTVTADFADINQAMQEDTSQPHPAFGMGVGVRPSGGTDASGTVWNVNHPLDTVAHPKPGYTYRLGD